MLPGLVVTHGAGGVPVLPDTGMPQRDARARFAEANQVLAIRNQIGYAPGAVAAGLNAAHDSGRRYTGVNDLDRPACEPLIAGIELARDSADVVPDRAAEIRGLLDQRWRAARVLLRRRRCADRQRGRIGREVGEIRGRRAVGRKLATAAR